MAMNTTMNKSNNNQTASFVVIFPAKQNQSPSMRFDFGGSRIGAFCPKLSVDFLRNNFVRKVKPETGTVFFQSKHELLVTHSDIRRGTKNPQQLFTSVIGITELPPLTNADLDAAFAEADKPAPAEPETPESGESAESEF